MSEEFKQYKVIPETKKCEYCKTYLGSIKYCVKKDMVCLIEKYGFKNIKTYTVKGPYSKDVIYLCDGKLEKNQNERT